MEFELDRKNQIYGRRVLRTNRIITGNATYDAETVRQILNEIMPTHLENAKEESKLFNIYFNNDKWWDKKKETRTDVDNKVSVPSAYAITRTLNSYCFGEPIKYIARDIDKYDDNDKITKQAQVEILSQMLDFAHNHDATTMATLSSSICGLGYKLCLPSTKEELSINGVPFVINSEFIYPQLAGIVKSNDTISRDVMGFIIGDYYDDKTHEVIGKQYTCWTKYHQFVYRETDKNANTYELVMQDYMGEKLSAFPLINKQIPLIEFERNSFRKGDWEVAISLLEMKNKLMSNRQDDIEQVVDYILVLTNCKFENEEDRKNAINSRLLELQSKDATNKPEVKILQNALAQNSIQVYADYIDLLIQESVGIPNRQERGGGGGDTGQAVKYRNGFRDLENNAGLIIPKADKAELQFLSLCIGYFANSGIDKIRDLKPYEVRCKFMRTLNDDIVSSSQAFATYYSNGISMVDALILSKSGTDPSEIAEHAKNDNRNQNNGANAQ